MSIIPTKTCPVCKGNGTIADDVALVDHGLAGVSVVRIYTCERCFGRGVVMIDTVEGAP